MNIPNFWEDDLPARPKHHESILVVDDEKDVREGLARLLQMEGYQVTTAENGSVALDRAKSRSFDLVLTDMKMPGLSGLETLMGLKQLHPELQVIVVTGYASDETEVRCRREGAYDFVTKPFDVDHLLSLIEKAVGEGKSPGPGLS